MRKSTIYQMAWLKAHWPAHYLAAFLSSQPAGYFPPHVVLEEAKLLGIPVLPPDVNRSASTFSVERVGASPHRPEGRWAIRIGLRQVAQVGDELADALLWERRARPFASLADVCRRMAPAGLTREAAEALVLAGACDGLPPRLERRRRLWHLRELWPLVGATPRPGMAGTMGGRRRRAVGREPVAEQLALDWAVDDGATASDEDIPPLPGLTVAERDALDYGLLGLSARPHPMRLLRRALRRGGVRAIAELADVPAGRVVRVAGWPISAQRPPTAHGMGFLVLEDEGGRLPVAVPPRLADDLYRRLRDARVVVVAGRLERVRWYRALLAHDLQRIA